MSVTKNGMSKTSKPLALAAAAGVAVAMMAAAAPAAQAAEQGVEGVSLTWAINAESGSGAFMPGSCNFLSAGAAGNTGASRVWTEADGFYKSSDGNVSIIKDGPNGTTMTPDWATKCQTGAGENVTTGTGANLKVSNNKVVFSDGEGTVDIDAGTAEIQWEGSFTSVYYSGLTYWIGSDPTLSVNADGTAQLKVTASGYAADMNDTSKWVPITAQEVTMANLTGVSVDEDGFVEIPEYLGVDAPASITDQVKTGANWGSFPDDFVQFQQLVGQAPYFYSSGGAADPRKPAKAVQVSWDAEVTPEGPQEPEAPEGDADSKDIDVEVEVPEGSTEPNEPGVFKWSIAGASANLGAATQGAAGFSANGTLPAITVSDQREVSGGWSLDGKAGEFVDGSNRFAGSALGWTPAGSGTEGIVKLGAEVAPGAGSGLSVLSPLASATGASDATLNTGIQLLAPTGAAAGDYTSTLTITAIQK